MTRPRPPQQRRSESARVAALASMAVAAIGVVACSGDDPIFIGAAEVSTVFIAPTGHDAAPGTREEPWRTFKHALPALRPGMTLVLLDGTYDRGSSGYVDLTCGVDVVGGTADKPITIKADHERAAFLSGDAGGPPFSITGCSHFVFEGLRAESSDFADAPQTPDGGSLFVLGTDNHDITLRRLLGRHTNRFRHAHGLRIGDGSTDVLVEECEIYDFHHNAFETSRSTAVVFRRNYLNARDTMDIPGGYVSEDPTRGDYGFFLEETRFSIVENNIVESVHDGIGIVGRYAGLPADMPPPVDDPIDGNKLLGNIIVRPARSGVYIDSRCLNETPCVDRARVVVGTELGDNVVVGGAAGVQSAGAVGTRINQLTVIGAAAGVLMARDPQNAGVAATSTTTNALAVGFTQAGFQSTGEDQWSFDHCATFGGTGGAAFVPDDAHVTNPLVVDPALGGCLVYLPPASPLRGAGAAGAYVGANIVRRYENGLLTAAALWDPTTHAFPCGAAIAGVSDDPTMACAGVNVRLQVGTAACPAP